MISDFSLFETNLPQLQQLFNKQTKTRVMNPNDLEILCTTLNIMPDLIGQSTFRTLIARIAGSAMFSKIELGFPEFLEIFKQIALTSFSSAPSIKEKCRRFFSHISVRCREEFTVTLIKSEELQPSKPLESSSKLTSKRNSRKSSKEINLVSLESKQKAYKESVSPVASSRSEKVAQFKKIQSARVEQVDNSRKNTLKITINLSETKPVTLSNPTPSNNQRRNKAATQKTYLQQPIIRTRSVNHLRNKTKKRKNNTRDYKEQSVDLDKVKTAYRNFKENHLNQVRVNNKRSQFNLVNAHREYICRQMNAMFRNEIVLGLIFRAWMNITFKLNN